ncbi:MAG: divalent-cation tolerance protein CutA [Ponticaulis sp.]|nr:divalent-cation tolerance protein CutA [Ponticaulis sp.]|tara:strand:+ start:37087 stop:37410 length:324 start_codon:yes stop_codon:yes gene_type:complete
MSEVILIRVNCPSENLAASLAEACVKGHLAACANIEGPVRSLYHWDGAVESGEEYVLWLKTRADRWTDIESLVSALHPDDTPAILAIPCVSANAGYEAWLSDICKAR